MKYNVIRDFKDLKDKNKIYKRGDSYPKPANKKVSDERIKQLTTKNNKQGRPVIEAIEEEQE